MKELIQRLNRADGEELMTTGIIDEAADALEKQQAEIERLESINRDALGNLNDLCDEKNAEIAALKAQAAKDAADAGRYRGLRIALMYSDYEFTARAAALIPDEDAAITFDTVDAAFDAAMKESQQ